MRILTLGVMLGLIGTPAMALECRTVEVTGYYTPVLADFDDWAAFVEDMTLQGWGKLADGAYVGYWAERPGGPWYLSDEPLDSHDNVLMKGSAATDPAVIPHGTRFRIADLPHGFGERLYTANDVGPAIQGARVDIYTGEGAQARADAYAITGRYEACLVE